MSESAVAVSEQARPADVAAASARRWWILGVVGLAQLMVILDATIVNIALPSAQRSLGFSNADRQWVAVHSYVVASWVSAGILVGAAVVSGLVLPPGTLAPAAGPAAPPAS
jgi:MFS family permease